MEYFEAHVEFFMWGIIGGLFAELAAWYASREELYRKLPGYAKSIGYWVTTSLMILAGGMLVVVYHKSGVELNVVLALNIGASAPLLISRLGKVAPDIELTGDDKDV